MFGKNSMFAPESTLETEKKEDKNLEALAAFREKSVPKLQKINDGLEILKISVAQFKNNMSTLFNMLEEKDHSDSDAYGQRIMTDALDSLVIINAKIIADINFFIMVTRNKYTPTISLLKDFSLNVLLEAEAKTDKQKTKEEQKALLQRIEKFDEAFSQFLELIKGLPLITKKDRDNMFNNIAFTISAMKDAVNNKVLETEELIVKSPKAESASSCIIC